GLSLTLSSSGAVSALKLGSTDYASSSIPSGFYYREPDPSNPKIVVNGPFQWGAGSPAGGSGSGGSEGPCAIDRADQVAGTGSMKLSISGSTPKRSPDFFTTAQFTLQPNTPYTITVSMKTSGLSSPLSLYLEQQDSGGTWSQIGIASATGTNDWKTYRQTFTTGPDTVQGYLKAYVSSGYGTVWMDDVHLVNVFDGNVPYHFAGSVTSSNGVVTQTASHDGLQLTAQFSNVGSAIRVDATLTDTTGTDRGIRLAFRLPLDIAGGTWDKDFVTPTAIESGTRYEFPDTIFATQTTGHSHSVYPFATVRNSTAAFSLAVPMGPLMDVFTYDDAQGFR